MIHDSYFRIRAFVFPLQHGPGLQKGEQNMFLHGVKKFLIRRVQLLSDLLPNVLVQLQIRTTSRDDKIGIHVLPKTKDFDHNSLNW